MAGGRLRRNRGSKIAQSCGNLAAKRAGKTWYRFALFAMRILMTTKIVRYASIFFIPVSFCYVCDCVQILTYAHIDYRPAPHTGEPGTPAEAIVSQTNDAVALRKYLKYGLAITLEYALRYLERVFGCAATSGTALHLSLVSRSWRAAVTFASVPWKRALSYNRASAKRLWTI